MKKIMKIFCLILSLISISAYTACDSFSKVNNNPTPTPITTPKEDEFIVDDSELTGYFKNAETSDLGKINYISEGKTIDIRVIPTWYLQDISAIIKFYNKNKALLEQKTVSLGNMRKNEQYIFTFTLSDNAFTKNQTISSFEIEIISGTAFC